MIEPTDEMVYAFAGEPEITATDAHYIRHGLAAVLAIVERDNTIRPRRTAELKIQGPGDHDFQPDDDPHFGSAFGGGCGAQVETATRGRITCGWPRIAHRTPQRPTDLEVA